MKKIEVSSSKLSKVNDGGEVIWTKFWDITPLIGHFWRRGPRDAVARREFPVVKNDIQIQILQQKMQCLRRGTQKKWHSEEKTLVRYLLFARR